jgi:HSP20 family protein
MLPVIRTNRFFPSLVNDFINNNWDSFFENNSAVPAVNIAESKDNFKIEVAAPGLEKTDFKIDVDNDVLYISSEKESKKDSKDEKYVCREFSYSSFKRAFTLPEDIDVEKISASHKDGVLTVVVPKKEIAVTNTKKAIAIS